MVLRVLTMATLVVLAVPAATGRGESAGGTPVAFVSAERASQLVAVDLTARKVIARIRVAPGPHNVAASPDLRLVLVTSPPAGRVTLVDGVKRRVIAVLGGFAYPHDAEFGPGADSLGRPLYAYVTDERRGELAVIDLAARRVVRRVLVGPGAHDLAVRPDGARVWVTHRPGDPKLTIVDTSVPARARVVGRAAARGSHDIAFATNGLFVWVTYWGSGLVGELRAYGRTGRLRLQERVGELLHHVQIDPVTGELWATDHGSGRTYLVSQRTGRPLRALSGCAGAHHIALAGTAKVVVACHDADAIAVYDRRTWRRTLVPIGAGPHGVAVVVA